MNTLEGNKMIAEFMQPLFATDISEYHTSWDWLMPVVEKIEKDHATDFEVIIYSSSCHIHKWNPTKQDYDTFISGVGKKIDAVYSAVIQFIQWYNKTNKS